jgi:hypothetical protein
MDDTFGEIMERFPDISNMTLRGERDTQDFRERDFDRRLEIYKVRVLATIAIHLENLNVSNT